MPRVGTAPWRIIVVLASGLTPGLVGLTHLSAAGAQQDPTETQIQLSGDSFLGSASADDALTATVSHEQLVSASSGGPGAAPVAAPVRARVCETHAVPGGPDGWGSEHGGMVDADSMTEGAWYYTTCRYADTGDLTYASYWQYAPGDPAAPGPDLAALARQAYDQVPFIFPAPATSPAIDVDQITGLPTWLWIDPAGWQELTARAEIPGFWVEVTATPRRVVWDMGDGTVVACDGPGTAYDPVVAASAQRTDCSHVYQHVSADRPGGRYAASATIEWTVRWRASTGATGDLADASRTTTFDLAVSERQAVVSYG